VSGTQACVTSQVARGCLCVLAHSPHSPRRGDAGLNPQVCYYRYLRFLADGRFLYRTSPQPLREVARSLLRPAPARARGAEELVQRGRWVLKARPCFAVPGTALAWRCGAPGDDEGWRGCRARWLVRKARRRLRAACFVLVCWWCLLGLQHVKGVEGVHPQVSCSAAGVASRAPAALWDRRLLKVHRVTKVRQCLRDVRQDATRRALLSITCAHPTAAAQGDRAYTSLTMANAGATEVRTRLRLRATVPGANNRLDIAAIVSFDAGAGVTTPMFGAPPAPRHPASCQLHLGHRQRGVCVGLAVALPSHTAQSSLGCTHARHWRACARMRCSVLAVRHRARRS